METGEVFYIGKGRGNRYKEYHKNAYTAEKIRELYNTEVKFAGVNLTEKQAIELESREMIRILNETRDRLTNRIIPFFTKRDNGYGRSLNTPCLEFEVAPHLYASEIDEHYFGIKDKAFDKVEFKNLKTVVFVNKSIPNDILEIAYASNYEKYFDETIALLEANGNKILKTKFAKSVTAWVYSSDDCVTNYFIDQKQAVKKLGRTVPTYHLIDVWKLLNSVYRKEKVIQDFEVKISAKHNRVPLENIKNKNDWDKGFNEGYTYWEIGNEIRKSGNIEEAIQLFDKARYYGYVAPALYHSYALAYRKLKDYDNEIAILDEGIMRFQYTNITINPNIISKWKEQRKKAIQKLNKL